MDPRICPLCGKPNGCMAGEENESACWCNFIEIPRVLLARIPNTLRMKACVCRSCVQSYTKSS